MKIRTVAGIFATLLVIGGVAWTYLVVSHEVELTTYNTFLASDHQDGLSNGSEDQLVSLLMDSGKDVLGWDQLEISVLVGQDEYACSLTGVSTIEQNDSRVETRLTADGSTFALQVDSNSEDSFTEVSLPTMREAEDSLYSLKLQKTDIFLGENAVAMVVEQPFAEIDEVPAGEFDLDSTERLDWYDYDLSVHRVNAKEQVYIIQESNITYKLQFISYYDDDDQPRNVQIIVAHLRGEPLPAFDDPTLIAESPCIIEGAESSWITNTSIILRENGIDICDSRCSLEVLISYQGMQVTPIAAIEIA